MSGLLWVAIALSGAVALITPWVARPVLERLGSFDVPNHRSSHRKKTLRGGGVGPMCGIGVGTTALIALLPSPDALLLGAALATTLMMGAVGLAEDLAGLSARIRAGLQFVIGGLLSALLCLSQDVSLWWVPLAALFFAANVNFTNFMDGVNGISSLHGLTTGIAFSALGALTEQPWLMAGGALLAITFGTFLPWNLVPPGMFLGDSGSYLLGGATAALTLTALSTGAHPIAALAPFAIYWSDTLATLARRALRRESLTQAHRTHTYQRLTNARLTHLTVALIVAALTAVSSASGLLVAARLIHPLAGVAIIAVAIGTYLSLPLLTRRRLPEPQNPRVERRSDTQPARSDS